MNDKIENGATREVVCKYIERKYGAIPDYPSPVQARSDARRQENKKWYAIIIEAPKSKIGLPGDERVEILDLKCNPFLRDIMLKQKGFVPACHIDSKNWIGVILDGSVDNKTVFELIDESYAVVSGRPRRTRRKEPTSLILPASHRLSDLEKAFAERDVILWKQSNSVIAGDTIYIYMAAPYRCIRYKCKAIEVDVPYECDGGKFSINVMRLQLIHTFDKNDFGRDELKKHGILSVRGPRDVPYELKCKLEKVSEK